MTSIQLRAACALILSMSLLAGCGNNGSSAEANQADNAGAKEQGAKSAPANAGQAREPGLKLSAQEIDAAGIKIASLQEQQINEQIVVTATIQANQDKLARVAPRVPGRVTKVMARLGDKVKPGQPLALIDSIEVGEAQSAYAQAASEQALARANLDRAEKLYADQIIPQKDYLRVRADFEKARAVLRAADVDAAVVGNGGMLRYGPDRLVDYAEAFGRPPLLGNFHRDGALPAGVAATQVIDTGSARVAQPATGEPASTCTSNARTTTNSPANISSRPQSMWA